MKKETMRAVPIRSLDPGVGFGSPLFIYLPRNDRFVPVRLSGEPLGDRFFRRLLDHKHEQLWTFPESPGRIEPLASDPKSGPSPSPTLTKPEKTELRAAQAKSPAGPETEVAAAIPDKTLVEDTLREKDLTTEEKAEILSEVGQQFLRTLSRFRSRDQTDQEARVKDAKKMVDQILIVASEQSDIYTEILNIRQAQDDIEHSTMVGTMAAMFALSLGYTDEKLLSDLVAAAVFHDVGLVEINKEFLFKDRAQWLPEEWEEYRTHTLLSVRLLEESQLSLHPRVMRMVAEHHEQYDGGGFPLGLRGSRIDETSQLIALANYFEHLTSGGEAGHEIPFADAFERVFAGHQGSPTIASPELVQRIYQFSSKEKEIADALRSEAAAMAQEVKNELNSEAKIS